MAAKASARTSNAAARVSAAGAQLVAEDDRPVGQYRVAFERQLAQRLALDDLRQRFAIDVFHGDERQTVMLVNVEDGDDVRMAQRAG